MPRIGNVKVTVGCPPQLSSLGLFGEEWTSFSFRIHDFASLGSTKGNFIDTPEFSCNGHEWNLRVFPGGNAMADEGNISAYLSHRSKGKATTVFAIQLVDKFGNGNIHERNNISPSHTFSSDSKIWGVKDFILRSNVLDETRNILDDNGTLIIVVSIKEGPNTAFVPEHPILSMIKDMFDDKATADVCFEVGAGVQEKEGKQQESDSSVSFHAHRLILKKCAPMLADLLGDTNKAAIADINPDIFHHLLFHVYGGEVPREVLKTHAKDIIDAADKYAIINLKLTAEAAYVESTSITFDNAIDNLLYADSKNCALLKEKALDFLAENHYEAAEKISFADFPPQVVKDLLIAVGRMCKNESNVAKTDDLTTLCVSALRMKMHEKGLEVDGSREAMIETLKNSDSTSSS